MRMEPLEGFEKRNGLIFHFDHIILTACEPMGFFSSIFEMLERAQESSKDYLKHAGLKYYS